jgi:hypothetical protein
MCDHKGVRDSGDGDCKVGDPDLALAERVMGQETGGVLVGGDHKFVVGGVHSHIHSKPVAEVAVSFIKVVIGDWSGVRGEAQG